MSWLRTHFIISLEVFSGALGNATAYSILPISDGGLKYVFIYLDNDGVTLLSAVIIYTDKSCDELLEMQIDGRDRIIGWYTTDNSLQLGMAESV